MEQFFQFIIPLVSTVTTCFLGYLFNKFKKKDEERKKEEAARHTAMQAHNDALNEAILTLCRERLLQSYKYFKRQGGISVQDLDAMSKIYEAYHALGGNGAVSKVYERIRAMAIKEGDFLDG